VHHDDVRCSELTGSLFCAQRAQFFVLRATRPVFCFARNALSSLFCAQRAQFFILRATRPVLYFARNAPSSLFCAQRARAVPLARLRREVLMCERYIFLFLQIMQLQFGGFGE
jgi:hypothetical protein